MNDQHIIDELEANQQRAPKVLYLEGKTDLEVFWALLGISAPPLDVHQGVLVREPGSAQRQGSGNNAVRLRVEVAAKHAKYQRRVFGICDGDGVELAELSKSFDAPYSGPLFSWKTYCIENLLAQAAWPSAWGAAPDWSTALEPYAAYVALNQLQRSIQADLTDLGLARLTNPTGAQPLQTADQIAQTLQTGRDRLLGLDVSAEFQTRLEHFQGLLQTDLAAAHALLNGKWLLNHFALSKQLGRNPEGCRTQWAEAARDAGGHPEVRALWCRMFGAAP